MPKCDIKECPAPAVFKPCALIYAKDWTPDNSTSISMYIGLNVCDGHRGEVKVEDFLGPGKAPREILLATCRARGLAEPDVDRATIAFVRITEIN